MTPVQDWREILRKAWSVRFFALSILFQGLDVVLSTFGALSMSPGARISMQLLGVMFAAAGLWARFAYQKNMDKSA